MGLLDKAALNKSPFGKPGREKSGLDEMGKALRDRLLSLPGTEPETAISLLKAYGSFRVGVCLSLEDSVYRSYAAVGIRNPIELCPDLLQKIPDGNRYSVDCGSPDSGGIRNSTGIRGIPAGTKFWAFSLDENNDDPPLRILLVGEDKNYIFPGEAVEFLVEAAKSAFVPLKKTEREESAEIMLEDSFPSIPEQLSVKKAEGGLLGLAKKRSAENAADTGTIVAGSDIDSQTGPAVDEPGEEKIFSFLSAGLKKNDSVHGLVFEGEGQAEGFTARINNMVSGFADTAELKAGRCLITGGQSLDCELLSHRLSASLPGKKLLWFSAENPEKALGAIRAYL